jgi:hypothetical protein
VNKFSSCQLYLKTLLQKPSSRRCQSAYRKFHIASAQNRPVWRVGLECAGRKNCNRYDVCSNDAKASSDEKIALLLFLIAVMLTALIIVNTFESFRE